MKKPSGQAKPDARRVPAKLLGAALRAQGDGVILVALLRPARRLAIVFANERLCAMTGHTAAELAALPPWRLHVDRGDCERIERWLRTCKPGRLLAGEGVLLRKDGSTLYAAWSGSALFDARGRATHVVLTYRDNTERRRLQDALVHSQRLEATGRLAGSIAHDFNNLLSVIHGYGEMLVAEVADREGALRKVKEMQHAAQHAMNLTRDLLAFGRRQPSDPRVINLNRLVQENAPIMGRLIGTAGQLELELADELSHVRADPTQLQQVLLNLITNARDALRDHGRITIATRNREIKAGPRHAGGEVPPGRYVALEVTDNGTGMDAETQKHLFEPFFTTKPEGKGTGLGLALVYGVVQQNAGYIDVHSVLLAGTTFVILFPAVPPPPAVPVEPAGALMPLPATRGHETVCVVEADDVVRKMISGMLTADGYRVTALPTPQQALALKRDTGRPIQLLIAGTDAAGENLAQELLERSAQLRLLRVSPLEIPAPLPWLPARQQAAITKPFALIELLRSVRSLLDA